MCPCTQGSLPPACAHQADLLERGSRGRHGHRSHDLVACLLRQALWQRPNHRLGHEVLRASDAGALRSERIEDECRLGQGPGGREAGSRPALRNHCMRASWANLVSAHACIGREALDRGGPMHHHPPSRAWPPFQPCASWERGHSRPTIASAVRDQWSVPVHAHVQLSSGWLGAPHCALRGCSGHPSVSSAQCSPGARP